MKNISFAPVGGKKIKFYIVRPSAMCYNITMLILNKKDFSPPTSLFWDLGGFFLCPQNGDNMASNLEIFRDFLSDLDYYSFEELNLQVDNMEHVLATMQSWFPEDKLPVVDHKVALAEILSFIKEDKARYLEQCGDDSWQREIAHQAGMMGGIASYNEVMGYDVQESICYSCGDRGCHRCEY